MSDATEAVNQTEKTVVKVVVIPQSSEEQRLALANRLIESHFRLSVTQLRIVWLFVSQINKEDEDFRFYRVPIKDVIRFIGSETDKRIHERLEEAIAGLVASAVRIPKSSQAFDKEEGGRGRRRHWLYASWVASAEYKGDEGVIEFEFSEKLKPYLLKLTRDFTISEVEHLMSLGSVYSLRIYLLLKKYKNLKRRKITMELERLRMMLGIDGIKESEKSQSYVRYNDFQRFVLDLAQREVAAKTDLRFEYKPKKTGRKITHIEFRIHANRKLQPGELFPEPVQDLHPVEKELVRVGYNRRDASLIWAKQWENVKWEKLNDENRKELESMKEEGNNFGQYVREKIQLYKIVARKTNIPNPMGWIRTAIQHNYRDLEQEVVKKKAEARTEHKKKAAEEQAARDAAEQSRIEAQKKSAEYDRRFSEMSSFAQEEIRRRATEMYKQNATDFERGRYEKEKTDGKTIDEMSVMVAVTYRKYRNQMMDSPEFAELDSEVNA